MRWRQPLRRGWHEARPPLWTIAEVAGRWACRKFPETPIRLVTQQDSRLVKPGSLFVALSGTPSGGFCLEFCEQPRRDGEFAANAQASACCRHDRPRTGVEGVSVPQLVVKDTLLDGLWALARAARARFKAPVIARPAAPAKPAPRNSSPPTRRPTPVPAASTISGRAADALQREPAATAWVVEMGMNRPARSRG